MITCDLHLHTCHSHDALTSIDLACETAIEKGLRTICTTEHVFLDKRDVGYGYFDLSEYLISIEASKKRYDNQITLLSGVEFSEPQLFIKEFEEIKKAPLDMIVGAMHWLEQGFFGDPEVLASIPYHILENNYYDAIYEVVRFGGFDTLAHMDLIKRYIDTDESVVSKQMIKILKSLIRQGIALEINTSTIRRDGLEPSAGYPLIDTYLELGGKRLTVGSDAHFAEDIGADFDRIPEAYNEFVGYFKQREFCRMK